MGEIGRIRLVKFLFWLVWIGLLSYGFSLQVLGEKKYRKIAKKEHQRKIKFPAQRGLVFDYKGRVLALNSSCGSVYILPQYISDKKKAAGLLSRFKLGSYQSILRELRKRKRFFWIAKRIDQRLADALREAVEKEGVQNAIVVIEDKRRIYPWRCCSSLLGFVGEENRGLSGLEYALDSLLKGKPGWAVLEKDALGKDYHYPSYPNIPSKPGSDVYLTIDAEVQSIAYEEVKRFVDSLGCKKGMAVILDVPTGAVRGLVNYPDFDPNHYNHYSPSHWRNYAVEDEYEPGSCFKHVIAAVCLEHKLIDTAKMINTHKGYILISGHKIRDAHPLPDLNFPGVFIHSSNVGVSILSLRVKPGWFYETARKLGFGAPTGILLPGEAKGKIDKPEKITRLRLANMAFGQGVTVTALQLAASYLAIANNGKYLKPYIIDKILKRGKIIYRGKPTLVRRALPDSLCRILKEILYRVVEEGTGKRARIEGIEVCGKTGTSQKPLEGRYSEEKIITSFVGFFPKEHPSVLIYVVLDEPNIPYYASQIACPLFHRIARKILHLSEYAISQNDTKESGG